MNYLKYTPYLYLVLGIYLVIDSIVKWNDPAENPGLTLVFAGLAFFCLHLEDDMPNDLKPVKTIKIK